MYLELILFVMLILSVIFVDNLYLIVLSFIAFLGSLIFGYNDNDDNSNLNSEDVRHSTANARTPAFHKEAAVCPSA